MNVMRKFLIIVLTSLSITAWGNVVTDSTCVRKKDSTFVITTNRSLSENMSGDVHYVGTDELEVRDYLIEGLLPSTGTDPAVYIAEAKAIFAKIRETQNYIRSIDEASHVSLPVGISKQIGGINYDIAIHAIRLTPTHAEIDVFMQFEIPQNNVTLTFMARGIKFTQKGGIVGDAKLELIGDYAINFNGGKTQIILKGSPASETSVSMDCDGFREMSLDADIKFSRDLIRPETSSGAQGDGNVMAHFNTKLSNWNDLVVGITLPAFQVNGLDGVGFVVQEAIFDFSDIRNAANVKFPEGYQSTQMLPDNPNLWRGFYMRQLTVKLPSEFKSKDGGRTSFAATDVIIDNMGFSGKLTGGNLLSLEKGDMNGWAFSVDALSVTLQANQITQASFNGKIVIPVSDSKTPFEYGAIISGGGNYLFSVSPTKDISFNLWNAAHVDIYESSFLEIKIADHRFVPKATLNGRMAVQGKLSEGGKGVELANITFEQLIIQSEKPYIKVGNFSFGSEAAQQKMAGFPISINNIGLKSISDTEVGLDFNIKLNLVGEDNGAFAADAGLTLVGKMDTERGWQSWRYKTILVREISVDIDGGAFKINGKLIFYRNDVVYGDGFNGQVQAEFTPGIKLSTSAIFGSVKGMRYWYVDGMVKFPTALPIFSGVGIYGFGGGAYFAMKMDNTGAGSELGKTLSGAVYVPDVKAGLGLKAIISLGSMPSGAFDAEVTFEIAFFKGGGVRYISFGGNGSVAVKGVELDMEKMKGQVGKMVKVVKDQTDKLGAAKGLLDDGGDDGLTKIFGSIEEKAGQDGSISARMLISYDFENRVLHGNFEVFVNVAGGIITGVGPGGRAGWSVLHFAPHEWYIYAGTPDDRVGVKIGIGSIAISATSYFMVGTKILNSPPPPPEVSRILGGVDLDYMKDLNALGTGPGFAFGAALSISTGELSFLMFYSSFSAGLGFDIMLKNYGEVYCKGSDKRLGINGWYANGQSYGYFEGAIGIKVKVFGKKKKVEILSIGAATVMQAKLPNPFWMRGIVGGYFRALGGLVKGNCKFQITLGKECEINKRDVNDILAELKVISELTPTANEKDISVFNTPQALFNMPVEKNFELMDDSDIRHTFRIKLDYFNLIANGKVLVGNTKWNDEMEVAAFTSYEILPPKKDVTVSVQVSFEEYKNGTWQTVMGDGQRVVEKMEQVFSTGEAPDYIPLSNVEYSYPVVQQANFYKNQSPNGYIKLIRAQPYLFVVDKALKQVGRFTSANNEITEFDFTYTYSTNKVNFIIPANLRTEQIYAFELINKPIITSAKVDRNVKQVETKLEAGEVGNETEVSTKNAEGNIETVEVKSIFTSPFRTSKYATLSDKLNSQKTVVTYLMQHNGFEGDFLNAFILQDEPFDEIEISGSIYSGEKPLIYMEADLTNNAWFNQSIFPLVYAGYPLDGDIKLDRDISVLGLSPVRAISIFQNPDNFSINNQGQLSPLPFIQRALSYHYDIPYYSNLDFNEIQKKVVNRYAYRSVKPSQIQKIMTTSDPPTIRPDEYKFNVYYRLPGSTKSISSKTIIIKYN